MKLRYLATATFSLVLAGSALTSKAVTYSVSASDPVLGPSPSVTGGVLNEDDLVHPGVGSPTPHLPGSGPPSGGSGIDVNAFSYGRTGPVGDVAYFSVGNTTTFGSSIGAPFTAVDGESSAFTGIPGFPDDANADIFSTSSGSGSSIVLDSSTTSALTFGGGNFQLWDGDGAVAFATTPGAPSPSLGLIEPGDNVDALDVRFGPDFYSPFGGILFWSVDPGTIAGTVSYSTSSSADIFFSPPVPGFAASPGTAYAPSFLLGLSAADDIDALVYYEDESFGATPGDTIYFSLADGSPTLGLLGASPADILVTSPGGAPSIFEASFDIGLFPFDELNGLDIIPEPGTAVLLLLGMAGMMRRRRR